METLRLILVSPKANRILSQFDTITETQSFLAASGPLEKEIRSFLVSVAGLLKSEYQIRDWKHDFPPNDDGYRSLRLFPKPWEFPTVGPLAFKVPWSNPFVEEPRP